MKEKPIIFSTKMVQAILAGRKTQTRRVIKNIINTSDAAGVETNIILEKCPYKIGQTLWVRETYNDTWGDYVLYKADGGSAIEVGYKREPNWKPSIHMPRKVARIFLKVKNIRIEQIQAIKIKDIQAEGIDIDKHKTEDDFIDIQLAAIKFQDLWDSINKKLGYGWDKNPCVYVIEFIRIEK